MIRLAQIAALCACALAGCQVPLPAIDPTGQRIFLPSPSSTRISVPECPFPLLPDPAYTAPGPVPPCPEGVPPATLAPPAVLPGPTALGQRLRERPTSSLVLRPSKVVAPIGSEVVLLAGLRGPRGNMRSHQTIEWILSQESVGHLVALDEDGLFHHATWSNLLHPYKPDVGKRSSNFAVTRTGHRAMVLTRGTPTPADDLQLGRGETWISITSPSEGTSHVTVWAPDATAWDQRRQTATVYWIDARWHLPPPAVVQAGQRHVLSTVLARSSSGAPLQNWIVRYQIVGGVPAVFPATGQPVAEVITDASGKASVEIAPQTATAGAAQVRIEIIRPATGDAPRLTIGQGLSSVSWSAPGLAVQVSGPEVGTMESSLVYRVTVSNPGDLPTRNVVIQDIQPPNLRFVNSTPPGQILGNRVRWQLGDLAPQTSKVIQVVVQPRQAGSIRYCFEATADGALTHQACADTTIIEQALGLQVTGPNSAVVGDQVTFEIAITNTGSQPLPEVTLQDTFDPGLRHSENQVSPIGISLGPLDVGATTTKALTFVVERPGQLCHTIEAIAGTHTAKQRVCLTATAPPQPQSPNLQATITGPQQVQLGQTGQYTITVTNTGGPITSPLTVHHLFAAQLQPSQASDGFRRPANNELNWTLPQLGTNQQATFAVQHQAIQPGAAEVSVRVRLGEQTLATQQQTVTIAAPPPATQPSETRPTEPAGTPASGHLEVTVVDSGDPVTVGETVTYFIGVTNNRDVSDRNVALTIEFSPGMQWLALSGPARPASVDTTRNVAVLNPIREVRPGEKLQPFRLQVQVTEAALAQGQVQIRVRAESQLTTEPVTVEQTTSVNAQ